MASAARAPADVARDAYLSDFGAFAKDVEGTEPTWLTQVRKAAISRFRELGFPTIKDEEWKYTSVAPITRTRFRLAGEQPNGVTRDELVPFTFGEPGWTQAVFVNGRYAPTRSTTGSLAEGVRVGGLADALAGEPQLLEPHLTRLARGEDHPFAALNTAFMADGAFVRIPKGVVVETPIHLAFVSASGEEPIVSHPRSLIVVGDEARATIIESYFGPRPDVYFTNAVTEVRVGEGAALDHYTVQRESENAFHVATLQILQGRGSTVSDTSISFGGALARNDVNTRFGAEGGELALNGLYAITGTQHVDYHTKIDHAKPNCTSREMYRGVLDRKSRAVFNGQIYVRPDAQKTNTDQQNKNLLLSKDALVHSTPGLEINADDVKCTHGSSIGRLDEDAVFYLRSRGIDGDTVRSLLTYAFAADVLKRIRVEPVRVGLQDLLLSRLPNADAVREAL